MSSIAKVQTSNLLHGLNTKQILTCWFNGLIKPLAMIHGPGQAGPWIDRWLDSMFRKTVTSRDSAYEIDETLATSCKSRNIFVNGSRRGLLD